MISVKNWQSCCIPSQSSVAPLSLFILNLPECFCKNYLKHLTLKSLNLSLISDRTGDGYIFKGYPRVSVGI